MHARQFLAFGGLLAGCFALVHPAAAQSQLQEPDPLAQIRSAVQSHPQVCAVNEPSACSTAAPKIVSSAMGPSPLADNLRHLHEMAAPAAGRQPAFRSAGVDEVHEERLSAAPFGANAGGNQPVNVVAEIRGREKPQEFVVLGALLDSGPAAGASGEACNVALVIEAARDIHLTGLRPRRSIRFVLFSAAAQVASGPLAYVQAHRAELGRAAAAVIFDQGCGQVTGFSLGGRQDIQDGVREAFSVAPVDSWDISHHTFDAPLRAGNLDFLLEGVPNLSPNRVASGAAEADLQILRRNTAVAGVLAFALAEHGAPPGERLSRPQIAALLKNTGLDERMKSAGLWSGWESGQRGRRP